jgi:hypothetical protein
MSTFDYTSMVHDCVHFDGSWFGRRGALRVYGDRVQFTRKIVWPLWLISALAFSAVLAYAATLPSSVSDLVSALLIFAIVLFGSYTVFLPLFILMGFPLGLFLGKLWRDAYKGKPAFEMRSEDIESIRTARCRMDRFAYLITMKDGRKMRFVIRDKQFRYKEFGQEIERLIDRTKERQGATGASGLQA